MMIRQQRAANILHTHESPKKSHESPKKSYESPKKPPKDKAAKAKRTVLTEVKEKSSDVVLADNVDTGKIRETHDCVTQTTTCLVSTCTPQGSRRSKYFPDLTDIENISPENLIPSSKLSPQQTSIIESNLCKSPARRVLSPQFEDVSSSTPFRETYRVNRKQSPPMQLIQEARILLASAEIGQSSRKFSIKIDTPLKTEVCSSGKEEENVRRNLCGTNKNKMAVSPKFEAIKSETPVRRETFVKDEPKLSNTPVIGGTSPLFSRKTRLVAQENFVCQEPRMSHMVANLRLEEADNLPKPIVMENTPVRRMTTELEVATLGALTPCIISESPSKEEVSPLPGSLRRQSTYTKLNCSSDLDENQQVSIGDSPEKPGEGLQVPVHDHKHEKSNTHTKFLTPKETCGFLSVEKEEVGGSFHAESHKKLPSADSFIDFVDNSECFKTTIHDEPSLEQCATKYENWSKQEMKRSREMSQDSLCSEYVSDSSQFEDSLNQGVGDQDKDVKTVCVTTGDDGVSQHGVNQEVKSQMNKISETKVEVISSDTVIETKYNNVVRKASCVDIGPELTPTSKLISRAQDAGFQHVIETDFGHVGGSSDAKVEHSNKRRFSTLTVTKKKPEILRVPLKSKDSEASKKLTYFDKKSSQKPQVMDICRDTITKDCIKVTGSLSRKADHTRLGGCTNKQPPKRMRKEEPKQVVVPAAPNGRKLTRTEQLRIKGFI